MILTGSLLLTKALISIIDNFPASTSLDTAVSNETPATVADASASSIKLAPICSSVVNVASLGS